MVWGVFHSTGPAFNLARTFASLTRNIPLWCKPHIYEGGSKSFVSEPISPTFHLKFQEIQLHSIKVASPRLLYIVASSSSTSESILSTLKQVWPYLWLPSFSKVLDPWKRLPRKGLTWVLERARNSTEPRRVSMVDVPSNGCHCHKGTSAWCELCEELHCRDVSGFETDVETVPLTEYAEELLAKLKLYNMRQWL